MRFRRGASGAVARPPRTRPARLRSDRDGFVERTEADIEANRQPIRTTLALVGLIGLPSVGQASAVRYHCADGTALVARFHPGRVDLEMGRGFATLPQARSADGGRYIGGDLAFWIKGRGAELTRRAVKTRCSALP